MSRSDRFHPIKEIADSREKSAGSIVAHAQALLQEREQKLEQLKRYREDYAERNEAMIGTLDSLRLQNYRAFLARLGEAIRQQEQAVQVAREDYERKRDAWRERKVEANALGQAIERFQSEERRVQDNREQQRDEEQAAAQRRSRELANETGNWKIGSTGRFRKVKSDEGER